MGNKGFSYDSNKVKIGVGNSSKNSNRTTTTTTTNGVTTTSPNWGAEATGFGVVVLIGICVFAGISLAKSAEEDEA
jgi:hypothetical protein